MNKKILLIATVILCLTGFNKVKAQLNGNYTIGGPGADYSNFNAVLYDLSTKGVNGPVVFNVYDTTFNEQVSFVHPLGSSSKNTITFLGNPDKMPVITFSNNTTDKNYTVKFDNGAAYIKFKYIEISNYSSSNFQTVVSLGVLDDNGGRNITLDHCKIIGDTLNNTSTSLNKSLIYTGRGYHNVNNKITNNLLKGGSYGIYYLGFSSILEYNAKQIEISNNKIIDSYVAGMYLYYVASSKIHDNTILSNSTYISKTYGIYTYYCNNLSIYNNKIGSIKNNSVWPLIGISSYRSNYGSHTDTSNIFNNFIKVGASANYAQNLGLEVYQPYGNINIYNNNVNVLGTNPNTTAFYGNNLNRSTQSIQIYNNIFNSQDGLAYLVAFLSTQPNNFHSDYNDLYNNNSSQNLALIFGNNYTDLNDIQNAGYEKHSISVDPNFRSSSELYPCQPALIGEGIKFNNLKTTIDGITRDTVFIGAAIKDYIVLLPHYLGKTAALCPIPNDSTLLGYENLDGNYQWSTGDTTSSIYVNSTGTYSVKASSRCGGQNLDTIKVIDGTIDVFFTKSVQNKKVQFSAKSGYNYSYTWDFGDGDSAHIQNPTHTYSSAGNYTVTLTISNECGTEKMSQQIDITTGINELSKARLSIQPNPSNGQFVLLFNELAGKTIQIHVIDMQGKEVYNKNFNLRSNAARKQIQLNNVSSGIYMMHIQAGNKTSIRKIVINK